MDEKRIYDGEEYSQPTLREGYTVLQVVKLMDDGYTVPEIAEWFDIPEPSVVAAVDYYDENTEAIESLLEDERAVIEAYSDDGEDE